MNNQLDQDLGLANDRDDGDVTGQETLSINWRDYDISVNLDGDLAFYTLSGIFLSGSLYAFCVPIVTAIFEFGRLDPTVLFASVFCAIFGFIYSGIFGLISIAIVCFLNGALDRPLNARTLSGFSGGLAGFLAAFVFYYGMLTNVETVFAAIGIITATMVSHIGAVFLTNFHYPIPPSPNALAGFQFELRHIFIVMTCVGLILIVDQLFQNNLWVIYFSCYVTFQTSMMVADRILFFSWYWIGEKLFGSPAVAPSEIQRRRNKTVVMVNSCHSTKGESIE